MNENTGFMSNDWLGAFLIIAILFGGGFGGFGNRGGMPMPNFATTQDVNDAVNNNAIQASLQNVLLSSANNNFETAQLISSQTQQMINQENANMINLIQGYNNITNQIMNQTNVLGSKLDQLGFNMEQCLRKIFYAIENLFAHKAVGTLAA